MADRYELRSRMDQDNSSSYAALPGTTAMGFVSHNMTPMKANIAPGRDVPGCHPSRWIYELIHNNFTTCDLFERARHAQLDSQYTWDHPHKLVINGNQSFETAKEYVLSCICLDCHFHFLFKMAWDEAHHEELCSPDQSVWPPRDNAFPWHHLVWVGSEAEHVVKDTYSKHYPLLARENFVCSAPPCTFQLTLEISEPRLKSEFVKLLLDHETIYQELVAAREKEPSRYGNATDGWTREAPLNINTYLKDLLDSPPESLRNIAKRNKRFAVLFGPRCFSIFRQLEFSENVVIKDGIDEGQFIPTAPAPATGPNGTTEIGTYRSYLEDVRAEVQCLIVKAGQTAERPTICTPILHARLGCQELPNVGENVLVNIDRYKLLGVLPGQPREIIANAYKRQWELIPGKRRNLVDDLMAIANDSGDELLSDYAMTQSSVFDSQTQHQNSSDDDGLVTQALTFLDLSPPNNYSADSLIQAFRSKLAKEPSAASTARSMLLIIAQASNDDLYQAALLMESDAKMSLDTARAVLGLNQADSWEQTIETAKSKLEKSKNSEEKQIFLDALDAVADHTDSPLLKQVSLELRQKNGVMDSGSSFNDTQAVNLALPVGLNNIGNTCYLNSLLQYLFTVKPVRDIVLNYENERLNLDDESIEKRRLGGNKMQMDRGEAVVAQAFVQELTTLFRELQTSDRAASRPSQRLANAVLLSTHTLLSASKQPGEASGTPKPPPLPARPPPLAPSEQAPDSEMVQVTVNHVPDSAEVGSSASSLTLVEPDDARPESTTVKGEDTRVPGTSEPILVADIAEKDIEMKDISADEVKSVQPAETNSLPVAKSHEGKSITDITMTDFEEPETIDQKVLNALEHQKRSSGTDQQDVEEVMGSILNRLQAAIRPSSIDEKTGIQMEKIMETFFVTTVNYTKKFDDREYQHEISFDRSITAYPAPEGPCSLYDALGRNFNQQILEDSKLTRYTAIRTLPPVLHVLIQRSQSMGSKNGNPVVIPETLYLDRYMDAPHDSDVFRRRVEDWTIAERIDDLKSQLAQIGSDTMGSKFLDELAASEDRPVVDHVVESQGASFNFAQNWDFDGPVDDDFILVTAPDPEPSSQADTISKPEGISDVRQTVRDLMQRELQKREDLLQEHLKSQQEVAYRLHAVICHRGHLSSGHYWVWIHDFEDNVWRWYNDADVKENKDTAEVLKTLSTSGEPYYLCYVRDDDNKKDYVNTPKREVPHEDKEDPQGQADTVDVDGDLLLSDDTILAKTVNTAAQEQQEGRLE